MSANLDGTHSIFGQPWWLDATAPGEWDAIEIEESGRVVARLPFMFRKRYGLRIIGQPPLTQTLGPWILPADESPVERVAREKDLFTKLIRRLPKFDLFRQSFHPSVTNWLPFYWKGFSQTTRYTYVLDGLEDLEGTFQAMGSSTRKHVRQAQKAVSASLSDSVDEVLRMAEATFQRQGRTLPYSGDLLYRISESARMHANCRTIVCTDSEGRIHSAALVVGDARRAYLLVSGNDPAMRNSRSGVLLRWKAIQEAAQFTNIFDFEGSMIEGVEEFNRRFGAVQTPYSAVYKHSRLVTGLDTLRRMIRG